MTVKPPARAEGSEAAVKRAEEEEEEEGEDWRRAWPEWLAAYSSSVIEGAGSPRRRLRSLWRSFRRALSMEARGGDNQSIKPVPNTRIIRREHIT
jgi:hypothetical protein